MARLRFSLLLLGMGSVAAAQIPSVVSVSAPAPSLICGTQIQVTALVQDQSFNVITQPSLTWTSSNNTIATVDSSGKVTALLPGIVTISATAGRARGNVQLQALPLRIDVTPATTTLHIGDQVQYSAVVLDVNQQPLAAPVIWELEGANGRGTSEAHLDPHTGLLTTSAVTNLTIRAEISYDSYNWGPNFLEKFIGEATATVLPPADYTVSTLLTSNETRQSFQLLERRGGIAVNDSEQLALVASLDGLSDGVLLADSTGYQILASGGTPALMPGGTLADFTDPAINSSGTVVVRGNAIGVAGGLLSLSKNQFQYLLTDGTTSAYTDFENTQVSRYSLTDNGAVVFTANYLPAGSTKRANGLFLLQRGTFSLIASSPGTTLPGLMATFNFDQAYGMDANGNVYFGASDSHNHGVYEVTPDGSIEMALGTGHHLLGSYVRNIYTEGMGSAGDLAIGCDRPDNTQYLLRYPGGSLATAPQVLATNGLSQIYSVNAAGVLFLGDGGQGWGLYLWPPQAASATAILVQGRPAPSGDEIAEIQAAAMNAAGTVFAKVRTASQPMEILRVAAGAATILFQSGDQLAVTANLTPMGLVPGAASGNPHVLMGGSQASVFELSDTAGLIPRVRLGDVLNSAEYSGYMPARKALDGTLYVAPDDGIFRLNSGGNGRVASFPRTDADGVYIYGLSGANQDLSGALAANQNGAVAWIASSNQNHDRLYLSSGGNTQLLAYIGNNSHYSTASPAGGYFSSWRQIAIDNTGRVMAQFLVAGGPSGYFLWANGQWTAAALFNTTSVGGKVVDGGHRLVASSSNFYATFTQNGYWTGTVLAEYTGSGWNEIAIQADTLVDGALLNGFMGLAVNRGDDLAYSVWTNSGYQEIIVLAGGTAKLAFSGNQPLPDGSFVGNVSQIEFRDDHRVFFTGFDDSDRFNIYVAQPNF